MLHGTVEKAAGSGTRAGKQLGDYLVDSAAVGAVAQSLHEDRHNLPLVGGGAGASLVNSLARLRGDHLIVVQCLPSRARIVFARDLGFGNRGQEQAKS